MNYKIFMVCIAMVVMNINGAEGERAAMVVAALEHLRSTFAREVDSLSYIANSACLKNMDAQTVRKCFETGTVSNAEPTYIGRLEVGRKAGIVISTANFPLTQEAFNRLRIVESK